MARVLSDHLQVLGMALAWAMLGWVLDAGVVATVVLVALVAGGWWTMAWRRPGYHVVILTTIAVPGLVYALTLVFAFLGTIGVWPLGNLLAPLVVVPLVGGVMTQVRPETFRDDVAVEDEQPTDRGETATSRLADRSDADADDVGGSEQAVAAASSSDSDVDGSGQAVATTSSSDSDVGGPADREGPTDAGGGAAVENASPAGRQSDASASGAMADGSAATSAPTALDGFDVEYGDIDVGERIGSGGNADVHVATVDLSSRPHEVALKTPRVAGDQTVDTTFFEQFREEAETWDRLDDHENVVTVYDWGDTPHPWIALEYMEAGDLNAWREDLDLDGKLGALTDVTEAVHHAHTHGVNHTDLKPGNVLFTERADTWVAKVGDWGLANVLLEHSQSVKGFTLDYAAPEQIDPEQYGRTDHQTDVYQLGVVAYELLTGELPFDRAHQAATMNAILNDDPEPPTTLNPNLPPEIDDLLLTALAKEKDDRQDAVIYLRDAFREL